MSAQSAQSALNALRARGMTLCVAESLTGGALSSEIVSVPGASDAFLGGVVAYRDSVKRDLLGVREETLRECTAVSAPCAREMARGARKAFDADYAIATTGYAGPSGAEVGLVYIAVASQSWVKTYRFRFDGGRKSVRRAVVQLSLYLLEKELHTNG